MPSHQTDLSSLGSGKGLRPAYPPNVLTYCFFFWGETAGWSRLERASSEHLCGTLSRMQAPGHCIATVVTLLSSLNTTLHCYHPCLFLFSTWHTKSHAESGSLSWGAEEPPRSQCSNRVWNGFGCWLMWEDLDYCAQCQPRAGGPGMFRELAEQEAGGASQWASLPQFHPLPLL